MICFKHPHMKVFEELSFLFGHRKSDSRECENSPIGPINWLISLCHQKFFLPLPSSLHMSCTSSVHTAIESRRQVGEASFLLGEECLL